MKILQITAAPNPANGQLQLFGLGEDNLIYAWSYQLAGWLPNNLAADQARLAKVTPAPANRAERRAATAKKSAARKR